jgi:hypothetical protein
MTKEQRLKYMQNRFPALAQTICATPSVDAVIPIGAVEVAETVNELDGFKEHARDEHSAHDALTSDEIPMNL